ncbi:hypothetical protein Y032_0235g3203 [Ancylostoma ceylanicum]|uniref:Uncharacterized protein n=1 Tax=Ancylostoma ceylanicum TaxID=53326 RepID=A0A016SFM3_9BILA|nr:hypothetical protein Y032_0235g3203 [Ancylostoma ceylanicum]
MGFDGCGAFVRIRHGGPAAAMRSLASATVALLLRRNARLRVRLGQAVAKTPGYGVRLGQAVAKTPCYGSTLAKEWRNRQGTGPPWRSSGEKAILRVLPDQAVTKT